MTRNTSSLPSSAPSHGPTQAIDKGKLHTWQTSRANSSCGKPLWTRAAGDQHRYHTADRHSYSGVRAYWHDKNQAEKRSVLVGQFWVEINSPALEMHQHWASGPCKHIRRGFVQRIPREDLHELLGSELHPSVR